jgi:hypothetical protein
LTHPHGVIDTSISSWSARHLRVVEQDLDLDARVGLGRRIDADVLLADLPADAVDQGAALALQRWP